MWWEPWLVVGLLTVAGVWLVRRLRKTLRTGKNCSGCGLAGCSNKSTEAVPRDAT